MSTPSLVTISRNRFACLVCHNALFLRRDIKLNSTGMELMGFGWANQSAIGLICVNCGYIHEFLNDRIEFWAPEAGYPSPA